MSDLLTTLFTTGKGVHAMNVSDVFGRYCESLNRLYIWQNISE